MQRRSVNSGIVGALALIAFGVFMLLSQNGIVSFADIWRLWPMFLVAAGAVRLTQSGSTARFIGVVLVASGIVLELSEFRLIPYRPHELWPLGIIALGLVLLWQSLQPKDPDPSQSEGQTRSQDHAGPFRAPFIMPPGAQNWSIFGGGERRVSTTEFAGTEVLAIFGGFKLDLRKSAMKGDSTIIDATALFGGVEILVPESWNVIMKGAGIFGGYVDESHHPDSSVPAPRLVVQGIALFGGVAVKN